MASGPPSRILAVEDDKSVARSIVDALLHESVMVEHAHSRDKGIEALRGGALGPGDTPRVATRSGWPDSSRVRSSQW